MPWLARFRRTKSSPVAKAKKQGSADADGDGVGDGDADTGHGPLRADGMRQVYPSGMAKHDSVIDSSLAETPLPSLSPNCCCCCSGGLAASCVLRFPSR